MEYVTLRWREDAATRLRRVSGIERRMRTLRSRRTQSRIPSYRHGTELFQRRRSRHAIAKSGILREEIFLTSKVWVEHYGYEQTKASVYESRANSKPIISTLCSCTNPSATITVHGALWKNCTEKGN